MKQIWNSPVILRARKLGLAKIAQNSFYLYIVLLANQIIPIITFPYLVRTLGAESFGNLAIAQSISFYLMLLVDFGVSLSGTREVAKHQKDKQVLSRILILSVISKLFVFSITTIFLVILTLEQEIDLTLVAALILNAFAIVSSPNWFFQGLERMDVVAYMEVTIRICSTASIFWLVRSAEDTYISILLYGIVSAAIYTIVSIALFVKFGLKIYKEILHESLIFLRESIDDFLFRISTSLYNAGNPIILSFLFLPKA